MMTRLVLTEQRRGVSVGHQATRLPPERLLLRLRYHADTVRYTRQALRIEIFPRDRHADQFALRAAGPGVGALGIPLADDRSLHPGFRRGK